MPLVAFQCDLKGVQFCDSFTVSLYARYFVKRAVLYLRQLNLVFVVFDDPSRVILRLSEHKSSQHYSHCTLK